MSLALFEPGLPLSDQTPVMTQAGTLDAHLPGNGASVVPTSRGIRRCHAFAMKIRGVTSIGRSAGREPCIVSALQTCNGVRARPRIARIDRVLHAIRVWCVSGAPRGIVGP